MELLSLYFPTPTQDTQHTGCHIFSLLRKSLCIIKMLPGNTPAVHIFYSMSMITWACQILANRSDEGGESSQLLGVNLLVLCQRDIIVSLIKLGTKSNESLILFLLVWPGSFISVGVSGWLCPFRVRVGCIDLALEQSFWQLHVSSLYWVFILNIHCVSDSFSCRVVAELILPTSCESLR